MCPPNHPQLPSPPSLTPKKKINKGLPAKGLWIFCRHGWQNINRKSMFSRMSMSYFLFPHYDVLQYRSEKLTHCPLNYLICFSDVN